MHTSFIFTSRILIYLFISLFFFFFLFVVFYLLHTDQVLERRRWWDTEASEVWIHRERKKERKDLRPAPPPAHTHKKKKKRPSSNRQFKRWSHDARRSSKVGMRNRLKESRTKKKKWGGGVGGGNYDRQQDGWSGSRGGWFLLSLALFSTDFLFVLKNWFQKKKTHPKGGGGGSGGTITRRIGETEGGWGRDWRTGTDDRRESELGRRTGAADGGGRVFQLFFFFFLLVSLIAGARSRDSLVVWFFGDG